MSEIEKGILIGLVKAVLPTLKNILGNGTVATEVESIVSPIIAEIESLLGK